MPRPSRVSKEELKKFANENPKLSISQIAKHFGISKSNVIPAVGHRSEESRMDKLVHLTNVERAVLSDAIDQFVKDAKQQGFDEFTFDVEALKKKLSQNPNDTPPLKLDEAVAADTAVDILYDMLLLVEDELPSKVVPDEDAIRGWSEKDRRAVSLWAGAVHLAASDNDVRVPPLPNVLEKKAA